MIRKLLYPLHQSKMSVCWTKDKKLNRLWSENTTISGHKHSGITWAWAHFNRLPWSILEPWRVIS
jgi:hypothetical protein